MIRIISIVALLLWLAFAASNLSAQNNCPAGMVCIEQESANKLYSVATQLVEAKDAIAKLLAERGASDAAVASALKTIEGWKSLDAINNTIIAKQMDVIALYEQVMKTQQGIIESLDKRLNKPKSAWKKFADALKTLGFILAGVTLGRGL